MSAGDRLDVFPVLPPLFELESVDFTLRRVFSSSFLVGVFRVRKKERCTPAVVATANGQAGLPWPRRLSGASRLLAVGTARGLQAERFG